MKIRLGVIIVTFNRLNLLKECICACLEQSYPFEEIYIINNASTDGTKEYLNTLKESKINIYNSKENLGGAYGFYKGIKHFEDSSLDYILLIDDDAILDENYNRDITKYIKPNDKKISGYSGTVFTDNKIQYEHRRHLKKITVFKEEFSKELEYKKNYFDYELSTFCGLFIPVKLIKKIGYPMKEFFIWFDDTEYSLRLLKYGKIRNINSAYLNHKTTLNTQSGHNWKSYYSIRNRIAILKKHFNEKELKKYICLLRFKIVLLKILSILKKSLYYKNVYELYRDALQDGLADNLGKNHKYIPSFNLNERK